MKEGLGGQKNKKSFGWGRQRTAANDDKVVLGTTPSDKSSGELGLISGGGEAFNAVLRPVGWGW